MSLFAHAHGDGDHGDFIERGEDVRRSHTHAGSLTSIIASWARSLRCRRDTSDN